MSILNSIGNAVGGVENFLGGFLPSNESTYVAAPQKPTAISYGVPAQYAPDVDWAAQHMNMPVDRVVQQLKTENGGNWDPRLVGKTNRGDYGISQLNRNDAIPDITGQSTGVNWFQNNVGHHFDINDGHDQIRGMAVYMNLLKQQDLPKYGIKNPTDDDVVGAYNVGARGYAADPTRAAPYIAKTKSGTTSPQLPPLTVQ